jgi:hypothetical protein
MFQIFSSRGRLTIKSFNLDAEYPHTRNTSKKVNKILDDFANQISVLESVIREAGHECIFLHEVSLRTQSDRDGELNFSDHC